MTPDDRQALRHSAEDAIAAVRDRSSTVRDDRWQLQTSNSFRRIGCHGDGDVVCGTKHPIDGHPDLLAAPAVLDYIVAAQPRTVIALLDDIADLEDRLSAARALADRVAYIDGKLAVTAAGFVDLGDAVLALTHASNEQERQLCAAKVTLVVAKLTAALQQEVS